MKIYTKTGDDGSTGLIGGKRVSKSDGRIDCVGALDEVNAALGWAAVASPPPIAQKLQTVQNELFTIGSHIASPQVKDVPDYLPPLEPAMIKRLEEEIDAAEAGLAPLKNFILPGGGEGAARLHLARTICRAAERRLVAFGEIAPLPPLAVAYLNRLSDWLFVQARAAAKSAGIADVPWLPR